MTNEALLLDLSNRIRTHQVIENPQLKGNSFKWLLLRNLDVMQNELGYERLKDPPEQFGEGAIEAFMSYTNKCFWLQDLPVNQKARALMHEIVHHLIFSWRDAEKLTRQHSQALDEILTEATVYLAAHRIGFDTSRYSVPYLLLYNGADEIETHLHTIVRLADGYNALTEIRNPNVQRSIKRYFSYLRNQH